MKPNITANAIIYPKSIQCDFNESMLSLLTYNL